MNTEISIIAPSLPAELMQRFSNTAVFEAPVSQGVVFPRISTNKRMFSIMESGADPVVIRGADKRPIDHIDVVVIGANPGIYKTFYPGKYVPGAEVEAPTCFSTNGVAPHASSKTKQATTCAECPHNVFGSRITESGKKGKACSDSKRLLVMPPAVKDQNVYMLSVSATALKGWNSYIKLLQHHGVPSPAVAITHITLNEDTEFPQLQFSYTATLDAAVVSAVLERIQQEDVATFMEGQADAEDSFTGAKTMPGQPAAAPVAAAPTPVAAAPAPAPVPVAAAPAPAAPSGFDAIPAKPKRGAKAATATADFGGLSMQPSAAPAVSPLDQAALDALVSY